MTIKETMSMNKQMQYLILASLFHSYENPSMLGKFALDILTKYTVKCHKNIENANEAFDILEFHTVSLI